jgi:hypothetical protein
MEVSGQLHTLATLLPIKKNPLYPFYRGHNGPQPSVLEETLISHSSILIGV